MAHSSFLVTLGILKLELGKELFERTGLTGKAIRSGGRKHAKERYRTLSAPVCIMPVSMIHQPTVCNSCATQPAVALNAPWQKGL